MKYIINEPKFKIDDIINHKHMQNCPRRIKKIGFELEKDALYPMYITESIYHAGEEWMPESELELHTKPYYIPKKGDHVKIERGRWAGSDGIITGLNFREMNSDDFLAKVKINGETQSIFYVWLEKFK